MSKTEVYIDTRRVLGLRDKKIYGHFLEHFHRQIYGGIYEPGSPLADSMGYREDVLAALKNIEVPVIRWPGGCFVSAHHWKDAIGRNREATFDKAWRVEESNAFGTDEFMEFCKRIGTEAYICTNAGTGTSEEMSDWVEYCNLKSEGKWAKKRIENGHAEPYNVKYWSIGNENYALWEIGAKSAREWSRFVLESAKMMKRVDPGIELIAASLADIDWNMLLLKEAGSFLDWISVHGYWDPIWSDNNPASYETCMAHTMSIEEPILKAKHILGALGYLGKIKIAYDEWNLRAWHHPYVHQYENVSAEECIKPRDLNDMNSSYTMADAIFTACFLNACHRHCDIVKMANFAPVVNTRGAIYTHKGGIVKRSTYFVFELYAKHMEEVVIDSYALNYDIVGIEKENSTIKVSMLDAVAAKSRDGKTVSISMVNKYPDKAMEIALNLENLIDYKNVELYSIAGRTKDSFNDVDAPDEVKIEKTNMTRKGEKILVLLPEHSVNILVLSMN